MPPGFQSYQQEQLEKTIDCPYCGQSIEILIDSIIPDQHYIEDCQVCCRPITLKTKIDYSDPDQPQSVVEALHENDY